MRSRTTSWVHITSLGYGETMATQTAKKNRECSSVRTSNYCRFAFVALLNEEFLRGSTNCRSREFSMSYCLIESSFPIVQFDKDSLTSFEWKQHKTSGNPIESSGKKLYASGSPEVSKTYVYIIYSVTRVGACCPARAMASPSSRITQVISSFFERAYEVLTSMYYLPHCG